MGTGRNVNCGGIVALAAGLTAGAMVDAAYGGRNVQVDKVVKGGATFSRNGSVLTIRAGDRTVINYRRFDVAGGETVRFVQPSATSRVLNRINSVEPSRIDGTVKANGVVYFVNPSGIMFGQNAVVNVGQLYAGAGTISDANFLNNVNAFKATGAVVNHGVINAEAVALIGRSVANAGTIAAEGGLVTMVAGDDVMLGTRDGHIMVKVGSTSGGDAGAKGAVTNSGTIRTGTMALAGGDMYALAIGGTIKAKRVDARAGGGVVVTGNVDASGNKGGTVVVTGKTVELKGATIDASGKSGGGTVLVGGDYQGKGETPRATDTVVDSGTTITASATGNGDGGKVVVWSDNKTTYNGSIYAKGGQLGGDGGLVEVSGKGTLDFAGRVDTTAPKGAMGSLLLDPTNLFIEASNPDVLDDGSNGDVTGDIGAGDPGTDSVITTGALSALLDGTNVSLAATNDIHVNAAVDATGNAAGGNLTLDAGNDIHVNTSITLKSSDLTLLAGGGVNLGANINTTGGDVFIDAGTVNGGAGRITARNLTIESATGIGGTGAPVLTTVAGGLEANASAGGIYISNAGAIALGFGGGTKGGVRASGGPIEIDSTGTIWVDTANHPVVASGGVSLASGGNVEVDNYAGAPGGGQVQSTGGAVSITSATGDVVLGTSGFGDVRALDGVLLMATEGSVTIDNASKVETDGANVVVMAGDTVDIRQTGSAGAYLRNNGAGMVYVTAETFRSHSGGAPASVSSGGGVDITADTADFSDSIFSSSGPVTFRTRTAGRGISLADAPVSGQLTLTGAQLNLLGGTAVRVGDVTSGVLSVAGTITQGGGWDTLHLSGTSVTDAAGGTIQTDKLAVTATGGVVLNNQAHFIGTLAATNATSGGIQASNTGDLTVGAVDGVSGVHATGSGAISLATTGVLRVDVTGQTVEGAAAVTLNGQDVVTGGGNAGAVVSSGGAVTLTASRDVLLGSGDSGDVRGQAGVTITAQRHVMVDDASAVSTANGDIAVTGVSSIQLLQTNEVGARVVNNGSGNVTLTAPTIVSQSGGAPAAVQSAGGNVTIRTDDLTLADAVQAGTGVVTVREHTAGRTIALADGPVGGSLTVTGAQLALLSGSKVVVGSATAGNISVEGTINQPTGWNTLHLVTGAGVSDAAGGTIQADNLAVQAVSGIGLAGQSHFVGTFAAANTGAGGVALRNDSSMALAVGSVGGVNGISSGGGGVTLTTGDLNVTQAVATAGGDFAANVAGAFNAVAPGGTISTAGAGDAGNVTVTATGTASIATALNASGADKGSGDAGDGGAVVLTGSSVSVAAVDASGGNATQAGASGGDGGNVTLVPTAGSVTLAGAINAAGGTAVASADRGAGGDVLLDGATVLAANVSVTGDAVTFDGTVNAATNGAQGLTVVNSGTATFNGAVGNGNAPSSVLVGGAAALDGSTVRTTGDQTYTGAVTLKKDTTLTGDDVRFVSTVDGNGDGTESLAIITGGVATFGGNVGSVKKLESLTVSGATTVGGGGSIVTAGGQSYNGAFVTNVNASLVGGAITFGSTVRGLGNGGQSLSITNAGAATFNGAVGDAGKALSSLSVSGASVLNGGSLTTTGAQSYGGDVTLKADTTLAGSTIGLGSAVNGDAAGVHSLALNNSGLATFAGAVGGVQSLAGLSVSGASAANGGLVVTTGAQTFGGALVLGADTVLTGGAVTFGSTVNGSVAGGQGLVIHNAGMATFGGVVGGGAALEYLVMNGSAAINSAGITTAGGQTYVGGVTLGSDTTLAGSAVTFFGTMDGGRSLTLSNTGIATFGGVVGGLQRLASITVGGASQFNTGSVSTTGKQTYGGAVVLGRDATFNADGDVRFGGSVDGAVVLRVNAGSGTARFVGNVGASSPLAGLVTGGKTAFGKSGAATSINVSNPGKGTDADISVGGDLRVAGNVTVQVSEGAENGVRFGGDIDGTSVGADQLAVLVPWQERADGAGGDVLRLPLITFATPNVGTRTALRALRLNATQAGGVGGVNAGGGVPAVATVFAPEGLDANVTGDFSMGRNEKLTAGSGDVVIRAGKTAAVGDLNAPGDIRVSAPRIVLQQRSASGVYGSDGATRQDVGVDFIAGGDMVFEGTVVETEPGVVVFAFGGEAGPGGLGGLSSPVVLRSSAGIGEADVVGSVSGERVPLDLLAGGASIANPATVWSVNTQLPTVEPVDGPGLSAAALALLEDFGVRVRQMTFSEVMDGLDGRHIYVQADEPLLRVAIPRLNEGLVQETLNTYATLFVAGEAPTRGREEAKAGAKTAIGVAYEAYVAANPGEVDPLAFRRFVEGASEHRAAREQLDRLRGFLIQIELLALTPKEMGDAKARICGDVKPAGMTLADFVAAVMGQAGVTPLAMDR